MTGTLYLIPTPLGETGMAASLPPAVLEIVRSLDVFVVENAKSARQFLKQVGMPVPLASLAMAELNEHTPASAVENLLAPLRTGRSVGLLSEAGCPGVADPGAELVAAAHRERVRVVPLVGPSSLLLALAASGLNGQQFCFHGYLPVEQGERIQAIRRLEAESAARGSTQLFIEAPYRNNQLLAALASALRPDTRLCLATELTQATEAIATKPVREWRDALPDINKRPTVFLLLAAGRLKNTQRP
jgi:16S rRNA (cytidine1402-2'-O)-methyltransferase